MSGLEAVDWAAAEAALDADGCAPLGRVLDPAVCAALIAGYDEDARFRSRVVMARHGFGRGEYRYFAAPLPPPVQRLREAGYKMLYDGATVLSHYESATRSETRQVLHPADTVRLLDRCKNILRDGACLLCDDLDNVRVMPLVRRSQRFKGCILLFVVLALLGLALPVELSLYQTGNWEQLGFLVELKVLLTIEMDGERWDTEDRAFNFHKTLLDFALFGSDHDPACDAEITIEPSVPETTAISLACNLNKAVALSLGYRLDAQAWRIGVRTDHANRVAGLPFLADCKRNDRGAVSCEKVLAAGLNGWCPRVSLLVVIST